MLEHWGKTVFQNVVRVAISKEGTSELREEEADPQPASQPGRDVSRQRVQCVQKLGGRTELGVSEHSKVAGVVRGA